MHLLSARSAERLVDRRAEGRTAAITARDRPPHELARRALEPRDPSLLLGLVAQLCPLGLDLLRSEYSVRATLGAVD